MKQKTFQAILFLLAFFAVERFCHRETQGFSLRKMQSTLSFNSDWSTPPLSETKLEKLRTALSQPFFFLTSGGECYVFISKDKKYVLKFFKHHHMRQKNWADPFLPNAIANRRFKRLHTLFSSCKLAHDRFRKETGLIFLHLNKSHDLKIKLSLFDPIGVIHKIDLDHFEFALQKKASLAYPTIAALKEAQEMHAAEVRIASLIHLIARRCDVGLADHDARRRNFGFIGEEAVEIDLGSFSANEELKNPQEMKKALLVEATRLRHWVNKYHPELLQFLDEKIKEQLQKNT